MKIKPMYLVFYWDSCSDTLDEFYAFAARADAEEMCLALAQEEEYESFYCCCQDELETSPIEWILDYFSLCDSYYYLTEVKVM